MCPSASHSSPSPLASRLLLFLSSFSPFPGSSTCSPCRFLPPPLHLPPGAPDAPIQGRLAPGCSSPGALLPWLFPSGFHLFGRFSICSFPSRFLTLLRRILPHLVLALVHVLLAVVLRYRLPLLSQLRTFQSQAAASPDAPVPGLRPPDVPVRVFCFPGCSSPGSTCLLLLLLPLPFSCSSCPLSPPTLTLVHAPLTPCPLLPPPPISPPGAPDAPFPGRLAPGCTCPGALLPRLSSSGFHVVGRFSFCSFSSQFPSLVRLVLPLLVHAGPCCSRAPRRFSPPLFPPPSMVPDFPLPGSCLPGRSSPGLPPPGCSSPGALLPRMFQSGFRAPASPSPPPSRLSFFLVLSLHLSGLLFMHSFSLLAAAATPSSRSLGRSRLTISCAAPLPVDPVWLRCFPGCSHPGSMCLAASPSSLSPPASRLLSFLSSLIRSLFLFLFSSPCLSAAVSFSLFVAPDFPFPGRFVPGRSSPGALRPRMFQSAPPGAPPDDPVRGFVPCSCPPKTPQSGASFCRFLSVASDVPVRGPGFPPGRSSPGACAVLPSAPDAPIRGVFLSYSLRSLGRSSPWHRALPRTIQSGGLGRAPLHPGCSNLGRLVVPFSPLPRTLQSVAPGSPPDDPVRGLVPCFIPPRMLQSGASLYRILSVASDAPVRGTWFTPGRSSPGACAVLHSAPEAPIRGVFLSYSPRCLGCSCPWYLVHPWTIQSGGLCRASFRPGSSNPGRLFIVFSPLPRMLLSVAPGSPPDDPVRGLAPCSTPPRMLQSGASIFRILSVASDAPVRGTGLTPGRSSPGSWAVLHSAPDAPIRGVFLSYSLRCLGCSSPWHRVLPRTIQSGGLGRAPLRPGCSNPGRLFIVFSPLPRMLQSVATGSPPDDPVRGLGPCSTPPRMLQSRASFYRILSVALDAPVRGTGFSPGRSSPGAWAVLHSAPDAPIRGVFMSFSLRCLGRSSP